MLSIQESVQKKQVKPLLKEIKQKMESYGQWHPSMASIYDVPSEALRYELQDTLTKIPLREFLAKSGSTGIAGAGYMVPDALHTHLIGASFESDKVPLFAAEVVNGWNGGSLKVDIAARKSESTVFKWVLHPQLGWSGAKAPSETVETTQASLDPIQFNVTPRIGYDLIEDNNFSLVEWHLTQAAQQLGQYATDLAISDLKAAAEGDGTQATASAGSDQTTPEHITEGIREVGGEYWNPNTLIATYEAWGHNIGGYEGSETAGGTAGDYWEFYLPASINFPAIQAGYDAKWQMLDVIFNNSKNLHGGVTSGKMTNCVTLVLDRRAALLSGRKRWMQINDYADPVADIAGATISCRQDNVTLYKDACCEITET